MAPLPTDQLTLLHQLRLRGLATAAELARRRAVPVGEVVDGLAALADAGLVRASPPGVDGAERSWTLTAAGRSALAEGLAHELDGAGARGRLVELYARFRALNGELLATCTAWQVRVVEGRTVVNDHGDPDHDHHVVARLGRLDDLAQPLCADLAATLARFGGYGRRLAAARARVEAGEGDWFTKPLIDSYHTAWFELHEDLLATLGLERADEPAA